VNSSTKIAADRGFYLTICNSKNLTKGLNVSHCPLRRAELRADLDFVREFVLKGFLQDAQKPTRPEIHKALAEIGQRLRMFLDRIADLGSVPSWPLADSAAIEGPSPFRVFIALPGRLRSCAERARSEARMDNDCAARMIALAEAADGLADILMALDFVSKDDVLKHLPWTADYHLDRLDEAVGIVRRFGVAVDAALAAGKKRGGPTPQKDLKQATVWLGNAFESYGGRFTHNPYDKTKYDGRPHSAAGQFVLNFLRTCDSTITEQAVGQYIAEAIRFRNRARSGQRGSRETSS
jgi:hypothetical protein